MNLFDPEFPTQHPVCPLDFGMWSPSTLQQQTTFFQNPPISEFHRRQDFQYFVVIDFEATCDKVWGRHPQEIIEFPSVIVNGSTGQLEACFQIYVRPTGNRILSDFCKDLTGIQQTQVNNGITLSEALLKHDNWLESKGIKNTKFAVVTWSNWDCQVMLESECSYKKITKPTYFNQWINLRVPFYEVFGGERCNLKEAVEKSGLTWQGRAHCGLDDAKNTARLLALLMDIGSKFSITNSLTGPSTADPYARKPTTHESCAPPALLQPEINSRQSEARKSSLHCYCGVARSRGIIKKPGPNKGRLFSGCGNWTAATGARCLYFEYMEMTNIDDESQGSIGRWGDEDDREHHQGNRHRDGRRRFDMHEFVQMGPKPLVGGETSKDAENCLERMES
ncbi:uncharacterized protein [Henckelia pumila]|uniref:uncharacterized protein n=1 Tax=Henckelia pumila TaxID=405737 RepID=UPI003C6E7190